MDAKADRRSVPFSRDWFRILALVVIGSLSVILATSTLVWYRGKDFPQIASTAASASIVGSIAWFCYHLASRRYDGFATFATVAAALSITDRPFLNSLIRGLTIWVPISLIVGLWVRTFITSKPSKRPTNPMADANLDGPNPPPVSSAMTQVMA